jgi:hypothetical protein
VFEVRHITTAPMDPPRKLLMSVGDDLSQWPNSIPIEPPFIALTALNARGIANDTLGAFAKVLFEQGCLYACSWGDDCSRVHDCFDWELVRAEEGGAPFDSEISTVWHEGEPLREAVLFAVQMAFHPYRDIGSVLVVTTSAYEHKVAALLQGPELLWEDEAT